MRFGCPGKVFITGEYACLEGGPSLIGTVAPTFHLDVVRDGGEHALPFHELSPAGLYLTAHLHVLRGVRMTWHDPYDTPIGVGSSSAQFIMSVAAVARLSENPLPEAAEVLETYWNTVGSSQGLRPSGVDVVAQWMGGPIVARNNPLATHRLAPWKSDAAFLLAFTGRKAKTHEHLKKLRERGFPDDFKDVLTHLNDITMGAIEAWEAGQPRVLGSALNAYQKTLTRGGLAPEDFTADLEAIQTWPGVHGCKGSGAQGGDCVLLLVDEAAVPAITTRLTDIGWQPGRATWSNQGLVAST